MELLYKWDLHSQGCMPLHTLQQLCQLYYYHSMPETNYKARNNVPPEGRALREGKPHTDPISESQLYGGSYSWVPLISHTISVLCIPENLIYLHQTFSGSTRLWMPHRKHVTNSLMSCKWSLGLGTQGRGITIGWKSRGRRSMQQWIWAGRLVGHKSILFYMSHIFVYVDILRHWLTMVQDPTFSQMRECAKELDVDIVWLCSQLDDLVSSALLIHPDSASHYNMRSPTSRQCQHPP